MTEDEIRRIIREELARAAPALPPSPVYHPRHYPEPARHYPTGWRPVPCESNFRAGKWGEQ